MVTPVVWAMGLVPAGIGAKYGHPIGVCIFVGMGDFK